MLESHGVFGMGRLGEGVSTAAARLAPATERPSTTAAPHATTGLRELMIYARLVVVMGQPRDTIVFYLPVGVFACAVIGVGVVQLSGG